MFMLKILIVEDDESLLQLYSIVLEKDGYQTFQARNGLEACAVIEKEHIDLVITDILMPIMDGYEFVSFLRENNPRLPILMITAKDDFSSKSKGFKLGTDDYMTKPVNLEEMLLRIKALLRRSGIAADRKLTIKQTELNYDALTVNYGDRSVMPPKKEFMLLYKLLSYPDKIFTRNQLMDEICGRESNTEDQTIDVHINRLRKRFQDNGNFEIITVRGLGYKAVINE